MKLIALLSASLVAAVPAHAAEPPASDRIELQRLAERMDQAWTAADADANANLFASKATARFGEDQLGEGRDAIREQFRSFFKDRPAGLRHVTNIERIERLGPDLALWDAEVRVEKQQSSGNWVAVTRIRNISVVVRQADGWRIRTVRAFPVN